MAKKYQEIILESIEMESDLCSSPDPIIREYINEPIIQKLLRQQEERNRFRDIFNPGISYGFYPWIG